jgi:hypothetical protein
MKNQFYPSVLLCNVSGTETVTSRSVVRRAISGHLSSHFPLKILEVILIRMSLVGRDDIKYSLEKPFEMPQYLKGKKKESSTSSCLRHKGGAVMKSNESNMTGKNLEVIAREDYVCLVLQRYVVGPLL